MILHEVKEGNDIIFLYSIIHYRVYPFRNETEKKSESAYFIRSQFVAIS